jgi:hypothetical protein
MHCNELLQLLHTEGRERGKDPRGYHAIEAHLRNCGVCLHGMVRLSHPFFTVDMLTCEQCRAYFPSYYEATRPDFPLISLPEQKIVAIALHLSQCPVCNEEYGELVLLLELEGRDELLDP